MLFNFLTKFFLFFIVLLTCCLMYTNAFAKTASTTAQNPFLLFVETTEFGNKNGDGSVSGTDNKFQSFASPSLSYNNGVLVVFAQAKKKDDSPKKCDIVEGYFKLKSGDKLTEEIDKGIANIKWAKRVITKNEQNCTESPTAVVNEDKNIFVFFKNCSDVTDSNWQYKLIDGTVENVETSNGIKWKDSATDITEQLKTESLKDITSVASGGAGIVVNEKLVVPVWYKKNSNSFVSIIFNVTSDTSEKKWKLVLSDPLVEGTYPAIVKWESNKLIMMILSKEGTRKVFESINMGDTWKEAVESISGVWGNRKQRTPSEDGSRYGFIIVDVSDEKKVMLVTQGVENNGKYNLHLWMTDNKRVYEVGAISAEIEKNPSSSLLYVENNLFVAYETGKIDKSSINVMHLKNELKKIKEIYDLWTTQDNKLSNSCFAIDGTLKTGNECTENNKIPTKSLVGFLSDNDNNETHWNDKYLCVNATFNKETSMTDVTNGLKFNGAGAGATWPVGAQGQNQRYHFAKYAFTLVAAVKIGTEANTKANSVLGIRLKESSTIKGVGLWCTKEGHWGVGEKEENLAGQTINEKCDKDKTYQVAFVFDKNNIVLYVDGKKVGGLPDNLITNPDLQNIEHFYFGADNNAGTSPTTKSHVTITNVLLYNRPFNDGDIKKLKPKKIEAGTQAVSQGNNEEIPKPDEGTNNTNTSLPTSGKQTATENEENVQSSSPPPTTEDSAARVGVVGVLCFMLFGVFTLLGRYVY